MVGAASSACSRSFAASSNFCSPLRRSASTSNAIHSAGFPNSSGVCLPANTSARSISQRMTSLYVAIIVAALASISPATFSWVNARSHCPMTDKELEQEDPQLRIRRLLAHLRLKLRQSFVETPRAHALFSGHGTLS